MTVVVTAPASGALLSGVVPVTASWTPPKSGQLLDVATLTLSGTQVASDSSLPLAFSADTNRVPDGAHTLTVAVRYWKKPGARSGARAWDKASIPVTVRNVAAKPAPPTGLKVVSAAVAGISLAWDPAPASEQVDLYQVYWANPNAVITLVVPAASPTYTVTAGPDGGPLQAGSSYEFRVSAHNSVGYGDWNADPVLAEIPGDSPPPPPSPPSGANRGPGYMRWGNGELPSSHVADYDKVLVSWGGSPAAGASSARLAGVYMSMLSCKTGADGYHFGVTAEELRANNWGLKTSGGAELVNVAFGNVPLGDPGIDAYALKWAQNVYAFLQSNSLDGVFIDDLQRNLSGIAGSAVPAKYPGPGNAPVPAWEDAIVNMCQIVYDYLHARGKFVVWNAQAYIGGYAPSDTAQSSLEFWPKLIPYCDGLMSEYWLTFGWPPTTLRGTTNGLGWLDALRIPAYVQAQGKEFCCTWGGTDASGAQYIILSMLLEHRGILYANELGGTALAAEAFAAVAPYSSRVAVEAKRRQLLREAQAQGRSVADELGPLTSTNQWVPIYDTLIQLGDPLGPKFQSGVQWRRQFRNAQNVTRTIWVDPSSITSGII